MSESTPAYSGPFAKGGLKRLAAIAPLDAITREWAWNEATGRGVKVAVIDTGIDASHPAVGEVTGYAAIDVVGDETTVDDAPHADESGHGTACAGIIRALAPECELYSVKVLGPSLLGRGQVFVAGLRWAIEHDMDVCNLSLGSTRRDYFAVLHELADMAYFRNVVLVTAANNLPLPSFPSVFSSVISVASHDEQDPHLIYYNPEPPVEFGAPGIGVRVPWLRGGWMTITGNSFAAPHITGLVAQILGKHPHLTPFQVKTVLRSLAANITREDVAGS
jgi:subtilisin family serine protease